jgi:hypothetical protein
MKTCAILVSNTPAYLAYLTYIYRTTGLPLDQGFTDPAKYVAKNPIDPNVGNYIIVGYSIIGEQKKIGLAAREKTLASVGAEVMTIEAFSRYWLDEQIKAATPPVFPPAAKYSITYRTSEGKIKDYEISNPIEANTDQITAYAFGRGVRTFKKNRISRLTKVG